MVFWIIGAGTFGSIAADSLNKKHPSARVVLVDSDLAALRKWQGRVDTIVADGIDFLLCCLNNDGGMATSDWIVPAIPVHIAYEWTRLTIANGFNVLCVPVPEELEGSLPNPMRGRDGELYVSHATSKCPENCPAPIDICTLTGEYRGVDLYEMLERVVLADHRSVVIRSHQLAPGVGGYQMQALLNARNEVGKSAGRVLMSTACRCHGVVHTLQITKR